MRKTFHYNVGFEVEDVDITIHADTREEADKKVLWHLQTFLCQSGNVTDSWVNDVKEDE